MKKILTFLCEIFKTSRITIPEAELTTQLLGQLTETQLERLGTGFCYLVQLAEQNIWLASTNNNVDADSASYIRVMHQKDQDQIHATALVDICFVRGQRRGESNVDGHRKPYSEKKEA